MLLPNKCKEEASKKIILLDLFVINLLNSLNVTKIVDIVVRTCATEAGLLILFFTPIKYIPVLFYTKK